MSIKDVLNYKVESNSTGMNRSARSSEEDMDKQLAEMRRNNLRRTPPSSGAPRPVRPPKPVKEKPVKAPKERPEAALDEAEVMAPEPKAKPVKEKPVKEKPMKQPKEKPQKEKKGFFGRRKAPAETHEETISEDNDIDLFKDVDNSEPDGDVLFPEDDMESGMDLFNDSEPEIRDIKDIEVKNISGDRLDELEDEDKDMKIVGVSKGSKPLFEEPSRSFVKPPKFKRPLSKPVQPAEPQAEEELQALQPEPPQFEAEAQPSQSEAPLFEEEPQQFQSEAPLFEAEAQPFQNEAPQFDAEPQPFRNEAPQFDAEPKPLQEETAPFRNEAPQFIPEEQPVTQSTPFDSSMTVRIPPIPQDNTEEAPEEEEKTINNDIRNRDRKHGKDLRKETKNPDLFDTDGTNDGGEFPDKSANNGPDSIMSDEERTNVLRKEIARNASGEPLDPAPIAVEKPERKERPRRPERPVKPERKVPNADQGPASAAQRRPVRGPGKLNPAGTTSQLPPVNAAGAAAAGAAGVNAAENAVPPVTVIPANPKRPPRPARNNNFENAETPARPEGAAARRGTRAAKPQRQELRDDSSRINSLEKKKEAGRREFESRRRNVTEDEFKETPFPLQIISYVAIAIMVIVALVCAFKAVEFNTLSPLVLGIVSVIMVVMGIFLGSIPSFITIIIAAVAMIAGALTGFFSEVVTALVVLLATVTALKGRKR